MSYKAANLLLLPMLSAIAVFSGLALAGTSNGWAKYHSDTFESPMFPMVPPSTFEIWVGWVRGTDTIAKGPLGRLLNKPYWTYLRDEEYVAQVWGGFTAGVLGISGFMALLFALLTLAHVTKRLPNRLGGRRLWVPALIMGLLVGLFVIGLYTFEAVGLKRRTLRLLGVELLVHPDWRWALAEASSILWMAVAFLTRGMPRRNAIRVVSPPGTANVHAMEPGHMAKVDDSTAIV